VLAPAYPATASPFGFDGVEQLLIARQVVIVNGEMLIEDGTGGTGFFPVTLKSGVTRPRKLSDLEGVVVARVVAPPEPLITVSDVFAKGKDKSIHNNDRSIQIIDANPGSETNQATLRIRVVAAADSVNEILNFPVQLKGRVRPFVRINRKSGESTQAMPEFQLRDSEGKVIKSTPQVTGSSFDGTTASFEVILKVDRPASGFENVNLTLTGRRSVIVEMPFVLKDVPLP
jgi:hypothetical protein